MVISAFSIVAVALSLAFFPRESRKELLPFHDKEGKVMFLGSYTDQGRVGHCCAYKEYSGNSETAYPCILESVGPVFEDQKDTGYLLTKRRGLWGDKTYEIHVPPGTTTPFN